MTKSIITKLLKLSLISGIYLSFFVVQLFFNFDFSSSPKKNSLWLSYHNSISLKKGITYFQNSTISVKANIRLNKRFEPNSIPDCIAPVIEIIIFYNMPEKLGIYREQSLLSSIKLSELLRGPPSIA